MYRSSCLFFCHLTNVIKEIDEIKKKKLIINNSYWSNLMFRVQIAAFPAECSVNKCKCGILVPFCIFRSNDSAFIGNVNRMHYFFRVFVFFGKMKNMFNFMPHCIDRIKTGIEMHVTDMFVGLFHFLFAFTSLKKNFSSISCS